MQLFKAVYPDRKEGYEYWDYVFKCPLQYNAYGLMYDGKLVCYYAFYEIELFALFVSAMTHPDYRKKGLFMRLANYLALECERLKLQAAVLFSNKMIYPVHLKEGFKDIKQIKEYKIPITQPEMLVGYGYYPIEWEYDSYSYWRYKMHPYTTYMAYEMETKNNLRYCIFSTYKDRIQIIETNHLSDAIGLAAKIGKLLNKKFITFWDNKDLDFPYEMIDTWYMIKPISTHPDADVMDELEHLNLFMGMSDVY